jgi:hypothetical protein
LFDIIEFFVKVKKEELDSPKFSSKTLKYIFGDKLKDEDLKTKIVSYDFFSINNIKICEIIAKISYYRNYYDIFVDYDFIDH